MIVGIFLLFFGLLFLLRNLGLIMFPISFWGLFWPLVLIIVGLEMLLGNRRIRKYKEYFRSHKWMDIDQDDEDHHDHQH